MPESTAPRHVLFISTDEQCFDSLGCNGNPLVRTPNLDALAQRGVRFTNHVTSSPICTPARVTWLTGLYPRTHGAWAVGVTFDQSMPTMPGHLAERGYATLLSGKGHFEPELSRRPEQVSTHEPYYGFTQHHISEDAQFGEYLQWVRQHYPQHYDEVRRVTHEDANARDAPVPDPGPGRLRGLYPAELPVEVSQTRWIADRTIDFMRDRADDGAPWMAWCSFVQPHHPWNPPRAYMDQYDPAQMPVYEGVDGAHGGATASYNNGRELLDDELQRMQAAYYAMITHIDDEVGRMLAALDESGQSEDTLIVFTSDHGDYNGKRRLIRKNGGAYEAIFRVPMIAAGPGVSGGRTCEALTQHEDLPRTMLEMLGVDVPDWMGGRSLVPLLRGDDAPVRGYAYFDGPWVYGVRDARWKLVYDTRDESWALTDLDTDPDEDRNRIDDPACADVRARLERALLQWQLDTPTYALPREGSW